MIKKFIPTYPSPAPKPAPAPPLRKTPPTAAQVTAGIAALRPMLLAMRWDKSGGYTGRHGGKWHSEGSHLSATGVQLDALFALAGITPDEIECRGDCKDCVNSDNGRERGYAKPCVDCLRPWHSNFVALAVVKRRARTKATP